ncbi:hypothetical protein NQ318_000118 [Aromia moschata]|uniref:Uncharacterized protein n=1 Tax=Aromia moschata TaxID=1265417 RepID=A0AAV8XMZ5_9CUCU|nr:hypothetical protein NQ318_000118 [Aromia moschata]
MTQAIATFKTYSFLISKTCASEYSDTEGPRAREKFVKLVVQNKKLLETSFHGQRRVPKQYTGTLRRRAKRSYENKKVIKEVNEVNEDKCSKRTERDKWRTKVLLQFANNFVKYSLKKNKQRQRNGTFFNLSNTLYILSQVRIYAEQYPERRLPHHTTFTNIHKRLREFGKFEKRSHDSGRTREVRTEALEEDVLNLIEESPETSTRKIGRAVNVSHSVVFRILKEQSVTRKEYPYHLQRVQALLIRDFFTAPEVPYRPLNFAAMGLIDKVNEADFDDPKEIFPTVDKRSTKYDEEMATMDRMKDDDRNNVKRQNDDNKRTQKKQRCDIRKFQSFESSKK